MKIIELLQRIANGEEVPNEIKYNNYLYYWHSHMPGYFRSIVDSSWVSFERDIINIFNILNDEVEIIEEETKQLTKQDLEALGYACGEIRKCFENGWNKSLENKPFKEDKKIEKLNIELNSDNENKVNCYRANNLECELAFKINEIIDYINNKD